MLCKTIFLCKKTSPDFGEVQRNYLKKKCNCFGETKDACKLKVTFQDRTVSEQNINDLLSWDFKN